MSLDKKQVHQLNMMNEAARRSALGDKIKGLLDGGGGSGESGLPPGGSDGQILTKVGNEDYVSGWSDSTDLKGVLPSGGTNGQVLAKQSDEDYNTAWVNAQTPATPNIREVALAGNDLGGATIASTYGYGGRTQNMQLNDTSLSVSLKQEATRTQTNTVSIAPTGISTNTTIDEPSVYTKKESFAYGGTTGDAVRHTLGESYQPTEPTRQITNGMVVLNTSGLSSYKETNTAQDSILTRTNLLPTGITVINRDAYTNFSFIVSNTGMSFRYGLRDPAIFSITPDKGLQGSQQMYDSMAASMGTEIQLRGRAAALDSTGNEYVAILPSTTTLPDISQMGNGRSASVTFTETNTGDVRLSFRRITQTTALPIRNRQITALNAGDIVANMTYTLYLYKPNADNLTDAAWIIQL